MYWDGNEDADAYYLKNQRQWVGKYLEENLGGNLDIYKNMACLTLEESDCWGAVHPRDAMLPELVLLLCGMIREKVEAGGLQKKENECICLTKKEFADFLFSAKEQWQSGWSKEYREMEKEKLLRGVLEYMKNWMLLKVVDDQIILLPAVGRTAGVYPEDFNVDR